MRYLLFITLSLSNISFAQYSSLLRSIEWLPVEKQIMNGQIIQYLAFKNADYPDLNTLIPNYYELIKIENNFEYEVEIVETRFESFDYEEIKEIKNLGGLPSKIRINSKVSYIRKMPYLEISFIPLRKNINNNTIEKLVQFSLRILKKDTRKSFTAVPGVQKYAEHSVLSTGKWFRIKIQEDGIYKLTYEDLVNIGIPDPPMIRIYGNGGSMLPVMNNEPHPDDLIENPIWFETGEDNIFDAGDYILFYGKCPHIWKYDSIKKFFNKELNYFTNESFYFLTSDLGSSKKIESEPQVPGTPSHTITSYDYFLHHELNNSNLIGSGSQWYGEPFSIYTSHDFQFDIPGLVTGEPVRMKINLLARASDTTSYNILANDDYVGRIELPGTNLSLYTASYATAGSDTFRFYSSSESIEINLEYFKNTPSAEGWLDYITINARSALNMLSSQLPFRDTRSVGPGQIAEFRLTGVSAEVRIWDISDPAKVKQLETSVNGSLLTFQADVSNFREFIAFNLSGTFLKPVIEDVETVSNQNIHGCSPVDYIIVTHPDFLTQARLLAGYRKDNDGLDTIVLTQQQIFNEFSSGAPDVSAIRNMVKMFYDKATNETDLPRYLLLFGDGSYDNLSEDKLNTNFILTYQSDNSIDPVNSFVTDDFFGLLDNNEGGSTGLVDIGIGRFPVKSEEEAQAIVNKTCSYMSHDNMGDWRNTICFIGDDEDFNIHMSQADELARKVELQYPSFMISKIYLDAYQQVYTSTGQRYPDVNEAINQRINKGALILNYSGHGGEKGLAHEIVLEINDITSWDNGGKLPLFITATCEFSRFDDWRFTSAGEEVILNPDGGGIALLSTTRLVYSGPNHTLNIQFYEYVFEKDQNQQYLRLGDIIRLTKNAAGSGINKRSFALIGDPALILNYPKNKIIATSINGNPVSTEPDTLKALGKVTITGQILNDQGNKIESYNGIVYPVLFDKASKISTLANDDGNPFIYQVWNSILYKGKASVINGEFTFSFIVPKDISYNFDFGKINFYGHDSQTDGSGSFSEVIVGGSADSTANDTEGPEIRIFMNDDKFVFGGTTNESPRLLIYVSDSSGINTVGSGIGHDLTAVLDNNTASPIVLNDYYETDQDSYQSGKIIYPLRNLEQGSHNLKIKVWDVYNNSSQDYTEFTVTSSQDIVLKNLLNYPNPFTTHTSFWFEHNQPGSELDILIQIFTVSGKLVKTLERQETAVGYRCGPIEWDGLDDFGDRIGRGVYIYRVKVRTSSGQSAEKFEKLVILR